MNSVFAKRFARLRLPFAPRVWVALGLSLALWGLLVLLCPLASGLMLHAVAIGLAAVSLLVGAAACSTSTEDDGAGGNSSNSQHLDFAFTTAPGQETHWCQYTRLPDVGGKGIAITGFEWSWTNMHHWAMYKTTKDLPADVKLDVDIGSTYVLRGIYGTKLYEFTRGAGSIEIPNLQLAHRTDVDDHDNGGRRGGGGAILLELLRKQNAKPTQAVGDLMLRYRVPHTDSYVDEKVAIKIPVAPDQVDLEDGTFEDLSVEKSFVMLNIFVGFQMAATRASQGDVTGAYHVLDSLDANVDAWLAANPDFDIEDDLKYIRMFKTNLLAVGATEPPPTQPGEVPPPPPEPWPND